MSDRMKTMFILSSYLPHDLADSITDRATGDCMSVVRLSPAAAVAYLVVTASTVRVPRKEQSCCTRTRRIGSVHGSPYSGAPLTVLTKGNQHAWPFCVVHSLRWWPSQPLQSYTYLYSRPIAISDMVRYNYIYTQYIQRFLIDFVHLVAWYVHVCFT